MFSNSVRLFDIFGFEIRVDASWLVIAALIVWSLSTGYFPAVSPGIDPGTALILAVIAMLGLFGSLILHELAHSLVARRYGLPVGRITLFLFGGVAELEEEPRSAGSEFWIAIAGPIMSFALAGAFGLLAIAAAAASPGAPEGSVVTILLSYLATINLILAVFNLIPAFPLDGGRVLRAILWQRSKDVLSATRTASQAGTVLAFGLMGLGLFSVLSGGGLGGIWMGLIGLFVLNASRGTYQQMVVRHGLSGRRVADLMTRDAHVVHPAATLHDLVDRVMLARGVSFVPVVEGGRLLGHVEAGSLRDLPREQWDDREAHELMTPLSAETSIPPGTTAEDALNLMMKSGRRKYLVAEGDRLAGVLSLSDLMAQVRVIQEIGSPDGQSRQVRPRP
jgi:Zn-dependent protease/predicted transcriptional regulator